MNKILVLLLAIICSINYTNAQATKNIIYIIDSIPVSEHLGGKNLDINPAFIDKVVLVKNKDSLKSIGYGNIGQAVLIFTKAYRNRPAELKSIPTTKQMILRDGCWYLKGSNTPYNGQFIDYYFNGLKQREGTFNKGKLTGLRREYFTNGNVANEVYFENGLANGTERDYYEDGSLKETGNIINNKEAGTWKAFFPNGQVQLLSKYKKGRLVGTATKYYSNGKVKARILVRRNKIIGDPQLSKAQQIYNKGIAAEKAGDYTTAAEDFTKCLQLNGNFADAYFARGATKLNSFQFEDAISDFDKAIEIEPYYTEAIVNRALCRIRKYQVGSRRPLTSDKVSTILAEKEGSPVPAGEKQKICDDLQKAVFLGDHSRLVKDAIVECTVDTITAHPNNK